MGIIETACADCGHVLEIPYFMEGTRIVVDREAFMPVMERHVGFNPEIHPTFVRTD